MGLKLGYALEIKAQIAQSVESGDCMFLLTITGMPDREEAEVISAWVQQALKTNMKLLGEVEPQAGHA